MDIQKNISLADKNWFCTGGCAEFYCEPHSAHDFAHAIIFAQKNNLSTTVLGLGANVLIADGGIPGLVIRPQICTIQHKQEHDQVLVTAGAGVSIETLINYGFEQRALGLEELSGIPGTVGGAIFINIHYFQYFLSNFVHHATIIHAKTGTLQTVDRTWFDFSYDHSRLHERTHYVADVTFALKPADELATAYAQGRNVEIVRHRYMRYPYKGTCGCFFRNFLEDEIPFTIGDKKIIYVSYYLDKVGVKGELTFAGARVSHQHANMIVNTGSATSNDIIAVARTMQELVQKHYQLLPQPECQLLGFKQYPLLS